MSSLAEIALDAYDEDTHLKAEQRKASGEEADITAVCYAASTATKVLGAAANPLLFKPIETNQPDTMAAQADLPGAPGFGIRYVYTDADETNRLYLIRPCAHCGHVREDGIRSLPHLGELLAEDGA